MIEICSTIESSVPNSLDGTERGSNKGTSREAFAGPCVLRFHTEGLAHLHIQETAISTFRLKGKCFIVFWKEFRCE